MMRCDKVIDLRKYVPFNNSRIFFIDTNVLYWYTYPRFSQPGQLTTNGKIYYNFIDQLTAAGNPLVTSMYNLTELLNVIEKNEYDIYCDLHPDIPISKKDFRKMPNERKSVENLMKTTLNNVNEICNIIDFNFSSNTIYNFVNELCDHRCDIFDYAILKNCIKAQYLNIISDDGDFFTMEKINLYTANETTLNLSSK